MDTLAAYVTELGPPDHIQVGELAVPVLGPTDVQIRTEALAVNQVDIRVRSGSYPTPTPFPFVIGRDLVGTVTAAGPGAVGFGVGDRVWCNSLGHGGRQGSFARDVVVAADRVYHLPAGVDPVDAVTVLHAAGTAYLGLFRDARIGSADTVIVGGAAGGVGSAVVQLAASSGARVVGTAADADRTWCLSSGAEAVVNYRDPDVVGKLSRLAPSGADVYWDTSGHQDLARIVPLLAIGARVVVSAAVNSVSSLPARHFYTHDISVHPFAISNAPVSDLQAAAKVINSRLADGILRPRIGDRIPLEQAAEAHRRQEGGASKGRIVVLP